MESSNTLARLLPVLALLASPVVIGSSPCDAQSTGWPPSALASQDAASKPSGSGRLLGLHLPFSGFATSMDSTGQRYALSMKPADHGRLTTTLEYQLAPRGPIGSFGLQTARDGPDIQPHEVNSAAALGPRGSEAKIGARIAYHF